MAERPSIFFREDITAAMRTTMLFIAALPAHERAVALATLAVVSEVLSVEPDELAPRNVIYAPQPERLLSHPERMPSGYPLQIRTGVPKRG